jgi:hypothetical protein
MPERKIFEHEADRVIQPGNIIERRHHTGIQRYIITKKPYDKKVSWHNDYVRVYECELDRPDIKDRKRMNYVSDLFRADAYLITEDHLEEELFEI